MCAAHRAQLECVSLEDMLGDASEYHAVTGGWYWDPFWFI